MTNQEALQLALDRWGEEYDDALPRADWLLAELRKHSFVLEPCCRHGNVGECGACDLGGG